MTSQARGSGPASLGPGTVPDGRVPDAERRARAAWSRLAEPGDKDATRLISTLGAVQALACIAAADDPAAARFAARLSELDVDRDLAMAARFGAHVLCPGDPAWPAGLDVLQRSGWAPYCLWVRGVVDLGSATRRAAAVVGARSATAYGEMTAAEIATGLAQRRFTVVSGAAFGIDAAAHRGTLAVPGVTIAVLAGGVERPYPAAHARLIEHIAAEGAVVSEVPPGSAPTRRRFLQRNRLIATMAQGTVVVEAGLRSGSLNTARTASDFGRVVLAVPGPVTSMMSAGCHELIRSGRAELVTDAAEVAEAVGDYGCDLAAPKRAPARPTDDVDDDELRVLSALPMGRGATVGRLAVAAGDSVAGVTAVLGRLELAGLAERHGEGWRKGSALRGTRNEGR
ncbi:MAG TPA: DNA-processing protein DprA [Dermatophilaceae bacterium]|nr:DNA-processing protein DprA [Dermatophilaceae bacterium]